MLLARTLQSPPSLSDLQTPPPMATAATMSLAILPPAPRSYNDGPMISCNRSDSPPKRPRLTLNTANLSTNFGNRSTSLRLETLSATSPTIRNTFSNAFDQKQPAASFEARPAKPLLRPLSTIKPQGEHRPSTPERSSSSDSLDTCTSSTAESVSSCSTTTSFTTEAPYKLAYNIRSILSNGPIPKDLNRQRPYTQSKPMFPSAKRVAFRRPLEETVVTVVYTMRHSDIEESSSTVSTLQLSPPKRSGKRMHAGEDVDDALESPLSSSTMARGGPSNLRHATSEDDCCPATPVAGRRKQDREWVWTLGRINGAGEGAPGSPPRIALDEQPDGEEAAC